MKIPPFNRERPLCLTRRRGAVVSMRKTRGRTLLRAGLRSRKGSKGMSLLHDSGISSGTIFDPLDSGDLLWFVEGG